MAQEYDFQGRPIQNNSLAMELANVTAPNYQEVAPIKVQPIGSLQGMPKYTDYNQIDTGAIMKSQLAQLDSDELRTLNNKTILKNFDIDNDNLGESYIKNMSIGADGKIYDSGITEQTNQVLAEKGFQAGPTQQNADLLNGKDNSWGYKEWGTAGNLGLGLGQLGLGVMSYLENQKTANAQRELLTQQYNNNTELMADRKAKNAAINSAFSNR
jgi:hypothetical protein